MAEESRNLSTLPASDLVRFPEGIRFLKEQGRLPWHGQFVEGYLHGAEIVYCVIPRHAPGNYEEILPIDSTSSVPSYVLRRRDFTTEPVDTVVFEPSEAIAFAAFLQNPPSPQGNSEVF